MSSYVSGGKVWHLPKNTDNPSINVMTIKQIAKHSLGAMPLLYLMFACIFLLTWFGMSILYAIIAAADTSYQQFINPSGGIMLESSGTGFHPTLLTPILLICAPYTVTCLSYYFQYGPGFSNLSAKIVDNLPIIFIMVSFIVISIAVMFDCSDFAKTSPNYDSVVSWMNDRYGFEPYNRPGLEKVLDGKVLYPEDTNFPFRDVYFRETNGAYYLIDGATQKELPVKN